ncbi:hypothetical protein [Pseudobacteriovorax antillogorgiicola]|uniref:Uncharacterized protein n=1 Tax=Pseudobacteriovorax antillogorgiicola TaxID=1513793 RepID=A0A1Y6CIA3_9BACT|nr:hypothetical protein [Pseudobacteriovorax antillogorgiicola]TCS48269.1 hypothetical protein EDD56_11849 [Pseudobacteriovorax antillogorgiicola]SMF57101.1 hypothetical protein SAMN06296036_11892 [Pseudobacteriovorax antillogorgiicola]
MDNSFIRFQSKRSRFRLTLMNRRYPIRFARTLKAHQAPLFNEAYLLAGGVTPLKNPEEAQLIGIFRRGRLVAGIAVLPNTRSLERLPHEKRSAILSQLPSKPREIGCFWRSRRLSRNCDPVFVLALALIKCFFNFRMTVLIAVCHNDKVSRIYHGLHLPLIYQEPSQRFRGHSTKIFKLQRRHVPGIIVGLIYRLISGPRH